MEGREAPCPGSESRPGQDQDLTVFFETSVIREVARDTIAFYEGRYNPCPVLDGQLDPIMHGRSSIVPLKNPKLPLVRLQEKVLCLV